MNDRTPISSDLHPHQRLASARLERFYDERRPSNCYLEMPTGSGKTWTTVHSLRDRIRDGSRILWIAHSNYLLGQAIGKVREKFGIEDSRIGKVQGRTRQYDRSIVFATVQTLVRPETLKGYLAAGKPAVAVFDEFHHAAAAKWKTATLGLEKAGVPIVGLSATPTRGDPTSYEWLTKHYPSCALRVGMSELIEDKVLARPDVIRVISKGEKLAWTPKDRAYLEQFHDVPPRILKRLSEQAERNRQIVELIRDRPQAQVVVFCSRKAHASHLASLFPTSIPTRCVVGSIDDRENMAAIEAFKEGKVRVLTNVLLLAVGVDLPICNTVVLAYPTQSEIRLKQMMGRAMRGPKMGGNESCEIIDVVDQFENMPDQFGTNCDPWTGENDPRLAKLRKRPSRGNREGADLALLLRLRDWLNQRYCQLAPEDVLGAIRKDGFRLVEHYDEGLGVNRALLIPEDDRRAFRAALEELQAAWKRRKKDFENSVQRKIEIRQIYEHHFQGPTMISEEDFVSVAAAALERDFRPVPGEEALEGLAGRLDPAAPEVVYLTEDNPFLAGLIQQLQ